MARFVCALILALAAVASARMAYQLPDGSELILRARTYTESFSCESRPYGYYADTDNNCEIFHVCLPINDADGELVETAHFSFICGNQTVFDQQTLTCQHIEIAIPCEEAESVYSISNAEFGVIPEGRQAIQGIDQERKR